MKRDAVTITGWDIRADWEGLASTLHNMLLAGAAFAPTGKLSVVARFADGRCTWTTFTYAGKRLDVDEGELAWESPRMQRALAAVAPAFDAWLGEHPRAKASARHDGAWILKPRYQALQQGFSDGLAWAQLP